MFESSPWLTMGSAFAMATALAFFSGRLIWGMLLPPTVVAIWLFSKIGLSSAAIPFALMGFLMYLALCTGGAFLGRSLRKKQPKVGDHER
jgi:hypothetical protein